MIYLVVLFILFIGVNLYLALSKDFSPIPYYPTNKKDVGEIVKALDLQKDDVLFDLGAGDGMVIFEAVKVTQAKVVGVEVHPLILLILHVRRLMSPHKERVEIVGKDLFKTDLTKATKIYLFVGPYVMKRILQTIAESNLSKLEKIVSYRYDFLEIPEKLQSKYSRSVIDTGKFPLYVLDRRTK